MSNRPKGVWGENPRYIKKPDPPHQKKGLRTRPVKSRYRHGRPLKNDDVSDAGAGPFIVALILILGILYLIFH